MTSPYRIERDRGTKESPQQIAVLREKWPLAFPAKHQDVRPLALGAAGASGATRGCQGSLMNSSSINLESPLMTTITPTR
jgi:hypothetical protein